MPLDQMPLVYMYRIGYRQHISMDVVEGTGLSFIWKVNPRDMAVVCERGAFLVMCVCMRMCGGIGIRSPRTTWRI